VKRRKNKLFIAFVIFIVLLTVGGYSFYECGRSIWVPVYSRVIGARTMEGVIKDINPKVEKRLEPYFKRAGVQYFPKKLTFVAFKKERKLEMWGEKSGKWIYVRSYKILAASGKPGPKLKEGDKQVPEGIYNITAMNPNSIFYLAMLVGYPNNYDKLQAQKENRTNLGGDICIHGNHRSAGCLAMGDTNIEDLFLATYKVGMQNVRVIIAPYDFRDDKNINYNITKVSWRKELYDTVRNELKAYNRKK
jgi:murein L,D-transpeptidase YafK